jgi:hypothetical protein
VLDALVAEITGLDTGAVPAHPVATDVVALDRSD